MLEDNIKWHDFKAIDIMNSNPKTINEDHLASDALKIMKQNNISQIVVLKENKYMGIVHIHEILKEGIF